MYRASLGIAPAAHSSLESPLCSQSCVSYQVQLPGWDYCLSLALPVPLHICSRLSEDMWWVSSAWISLGVLALVLLLPCLALTSFVRTQQNLSLSLSSLFLLTQNLVRYEMDMSFDLGPLDNECHFWQRLGHVPPCQSTLSCKTGKNQNGIQHRKKNQTYKYISTL